MQLSRSQVRALFGAPRTRQMTTKRGPPWSVIASAIGFFTSLAAFGFSGVAFFNSIEQVDDVRVVTNSWPIIRFFPPSQASVFTSGNWTFTNAGNRSAAIVSAIIAIAADIPEPADDQCSQKLFGVVRYNFESFVIKPKDVVLKHVEAENDKMLQLSLTNFDPRKPTKVKACNIVFLVTPDEAIRAVQVTYTSTWDLETHPFETQSEPEPPLYGKDVRPWVLVNRKRSSFLKWEENAR